MRDVRRKMTVGTGAVALAAILAACGGQAAASTDRVESSSTKAATETPSASAKQDAKVTAENVGFVAGDVLTTAYATIQNPTGDVVEATVNFAAYDAAGTVLGTDDGSIVYVRSGDTQLTTAILSVPDGAVVAKVTGQVQVMDSAKDEHPESKMAASNLSITGDTYDLKVTGTIDSNYEKSLTNVLLHAVCTNDAGAVVAAGFTYMDGTVVKGTPAPFEIMLDGVTPTACTVTASLSNLTEAS